MHKVGIVGAGYIAEHHLNALRKMDDVQVVAICDVNIRRAQELANQYSECTAYASLQEMLEAEKLSTVHILTPPDSHISTAEACVQKGLHVFLEKPMGIGASACKNLEDIALTKGVHLGVNHNFLFYPSYQRLKEAIRQQALGKINNLTLHWQKNMDQVRSGPFNSWMLREPQNLWLETAPHLVSIIIDLIGYPSELNVWVDGPFQLLSGKITYRKWIISGLSNGITFEILLSHTPGMEEKKLLVRGDVGLGELDFDRDTFVCTRHTPHNLPFDNYHITKNVSSDLSKQGWQNIKNYVLSKLHLASHGDPYALSIAKSIQAFYAGLKKSPSTSHIGSQVIACSEWAVSQANLMKNQPPALVKKESTPKILILGGGGFIGRALTEELLRRGESVRVLVRDVDKMVPLQLTGKLEIFPGDILNESSLLNSCEGIEQVYHLATAHVKTWNDYLRKDVEATRRVGEACQKVGVKKLLYTGTIDSYFAGGRNTITESTSYDRRLGERNYYAQAKAQGESVLRSMDNVPLVIVRPGIVLGVGGCPFHWGVGMWMYESLCRLWGSGSHPLPFVLVDDVVNGLIAAMNSGNSVGQSYNLVDEPLLSGLEYLQELQKASRANFEVIPTSIWRFYLEECFKWCVKVVVGHKERKRPSYRDWQSRTQLATFNSNKAREELNWHPIGDKQEMIERGIKRPLEYWWS